MRKRNFIFIIFIIVFTLTSCNSINIEDTTDIKYEEYRKFDESLSYGSLIGAYTNNTTDDLRTENMMFLPQDEVIYLNFGSDGAKKEVMVKIFYDYQLIDFKLVNEDTYISEYIFTLEDGKKIELPIRLDEEKIVRDNKIHKLMVTFITGHNKKASNYDIVTDDYGLNAIYDLVHTLDFENEIYALNYYDFIIPENNFENTYSDFTLNFDYENMEQNKKPSGGILNPAPKFDYDGGEILPIMYNINKNNSGYALIILTLNFNQVGINDNKFFQLIKLDNKNGTANGTINIKTPSEPGDYEVIGYLILDPFDKQVEIINAVSFSQRFTLSIN